MKNRVFELLESAAFLGPGAGALEDDVVVAGSLLVLNGTPDECAAVASQTGRDVFPIAADWLESVSRNTKPFEVLQ